MGFTVEIKLTDKETGEVFIISDRSLKVVKVKREKLSSKIPEAAREATEAAVKRATDRSKPFNVYSMFSSEFERIEKEKDKIYPESTYEIIS